MESAASVGAEEIPWNFLPWKNQPALLDSLLCNLQMPSNVPASRTVIRHHAFLSAERIKWREGTSKKL